MEYTKVKFSLLWYSDKGFLLDTDRKRLHSLVTSWRIVNKIYFMHKFFQVDGIIDWEEQLRNLRDDKDDDDFAIVEKPGVR